jgi:hypothetical protein
MIESSPEEAFSLQSLDSQNKMLKQELLKWQEDQRQEMEGRMTALMNEWQSSASKANAQMVALVEAKFDAIDAKIQAATEVKRNAASKSAGGTASAAPMKGPPISAVPGGFGGPPSASLALNAPAVQVKQMEAEAEQQLATEQPSLPSSSKPKELAKLRPKSTGNHAIIAPLSPGMSSKKVVPMGSDSDDAASSTLVKFPENSSVVPQKASYNRQSSIERINNTDLTKAKASKRVSISSEPELRWVLLPMSRVRLSWDLFILILILYYIIAVPINLAFPYTVPPDIMEYTLNAFFLLDIFLNFFTAVYTSEGNLIVDPRSIAIEYLSFWFWIDFVASFPLEAVSTSNHSLGGVKIAKVFRILRIFKLLRLLKMQKIVHQIRELTTVNPSTILILQTLIAIMVTWHWTACVYWMISEVEGKDGYTRWQRATDYEKLQKEGLCSEEEMDMGGCSDTDSEGTPWFSSEAERLNYEYAYAVFWAISVTTGTGWDIAPGTPLEVL